MFPSLQKMRTRTRLETSILIPGNKEQNYLLYPSFEMTSTSTTIMWIAVRHFRMVKCAGLTADFTSTRSPRNRYIIQEIHRNRLTSELEPNYIWGEFSREEAPSRLILGAVRWQQ